MNPSPKTHAISRNPATGEVLNAYPWASAAHINNVLARAHQGYQHWRGVNIERRMEKLYAIAHLLEAQQDILAHCICREMGKPVQQARAEVQKCVQLCR